jgi:hypothetical protein
MPPTAKSGTAIPARLSLGRAVAPQSGRLAVSRATARESRAPAALATGAPDRHREPESSRFVFWLPERNPLRTAGASSGHPPRLDPLLLGA